MTGFLAQLLCSVLLAFQADVILPQMSSVDPDTAKVGSLVIIAGEHLEKTRVAKVFLTDGKTDVETQVSEQSETRIRIRVPDKIKPGRYQLMVQTTGQYPKLVEQPVKLTVEP